MYEWSDGSGLSPLLTMKCFLYSSLSILNLFLRNSSMDGWMRAERWVFPPPLSLSFLRSDLDASLSSFRWCIWSRRGRETWALETKEVVSQSARENFREVRHNIISFIFLTIYAHFILVKPIPIECASFLSESRCRGIQMIRFRRFFEKEIPGTEKREHLCFEYTDQLHYLLWF